MRAATSNLPVKDYYPVTLLAGGAVPAKVGSGDYVGT